MMKSIAIAAVAVLATVWAAKSDAGWRLEIRDQDEPPGVWWEWDWFATRELCEANARLEAEISGLEFRCVEGDG